MALLQGKREKWCDLLENLIECPVCCEIPPNNILQCELGHHICISCRYKLTLCPICNGRFGSIRNFLAENICNKYIEIMASLKIPTIKEEKEILEKKLCIFTQTENISKTSVLVQTENVLLCNNKQTQCNIYERETQHVLTPYNLRASRTYYFIPKGNFQCCFTSCLISPLPFKQIMEHLKSYHNDTFYEVEKTWGVYKKKLELEYVSPKNYDFAINIINIGLFFIKIKILPSSDLKSEVLMANRASICKRYMFEMIIGNGQKTETFSGLVKSCKYVDSESLKDCIYIKKKKMEEIADVNNGSLFDCNFIIKNLNLMKENHDSVNHE
ncbi:PREDICTED: uncharacterized protein LOC107065268 [Polistes dominula]|uniref:Uncharacterized protein LOC107065268 n=1 Tax=Polistes dominula TaxID=743375 RepID=A0ABM1I243_POLDO|nr:PREDICTED: uncharacterized protein LOC107065268 [Polistes dominula]